MDMKVVKAKIAVAMPLRLPSFFNCCAIEKVNTSIYGNFGEVEEC